MSTTTEMKTRVTKGKLAQNLKVGDVIVNTFVGSDGKIKVCLETVREIITNELGKPEFVARTSWSYGPARTGSSHFEAGRYDYIPVL